MVAWMQAEYSRRMRAARSVGVLAEVAALDARLKAGVADLEADELAAAFKNVEAKRRDLLAVGTPGGIALQGTRRAAGGGRGLPGYRSPGSRGGRRGGAEARLILRPMLGPITLEPDADGALWAS